MKLRTLRFGKGDGFVIIDNGVAELTDGVPGKDGVGVEGDDDLGLRLCETEVERCGLAAIFLGEYAHARVATEGIAGNAIGGVTGAVVDDDDLEVARRRPS
jgi:hypothetical protein